MPKNIAQKQGKIAELLQELIEMGDHEQVRRGLKRLHPSTIVRPLALKFGVLARRAQLPWLTLRILNRWVRPSRHHPEDVTDAEKVEYAGALVRIGAVVEAKELLQTVDAQKVPQALLYLSHANFSEWNYAASIPALREFIAHPEISSYESLVGKVNLAAALIDVGDKAAGDLLMEIRIQTEREKRFHLLGNILELTAQWCIERGYFDEAIRVLDDAEKFLRRTGGLDLLFVEKWKSVVSFRKDPNEKEALTKLQSVRVRAFNLNHWETLRDCDFWRAVVESSKERMLLVYFGTPYATYRKKILCEMPLAIPDAYPWMPEVTKNNPSENVPVLNLLGGERPKRGSALKVGQVKHRLLLALVRDFYRPRTMAQLFSELHPGEFFNPLVSPMRIHQAVRALREYFNVNRLPFSIEESSGTYRLVCVRPCKLMVPRHLDGLTEDLHWRSLKVAFGNSSFTAEQASLCLKRPRRSAFRFLQQGLERAVITIRGNGRDRKYQFS